MREACIRLSTIREINFSCVKGFPSAMAVGCGKSKGEIVKKIESSTGKSSGSKRWFIIMAVAVLEVAVVGGGGLWR